MHQWIYSIFFYITITILLLFNLHFIYFHHYFHIFSFYTCLYYHRRLLFLIFFFRSFNQSIHLSIYISIYLSLPSFLPSFLPSLASILPIWLTPLQILSDHNQLSYFISLSDCWYKIVKIIISRIFGFCFDEFNDQFMDLSSINPSVNILHQINQNLNWYNKL